MNLRTVTLALLAPLALSACVINSGNPSHATHTTLGQELVDLKVALEKEAITETEYLAMKAKLQKDRSALNVEHEDD